MSQFIKVFTKKTNPAPVKTDKAEEKLLDDDQYVPPPGHIGFIKGLWFNSEGFGAAQFVSLGGARSKNLEPCKWDFQPKSWLVEAPMHIGVEATADGLDRQDSMDDEELASVDDLLYSEQELF